MNNPMFTTTNIIKNGPADHKKWLEWLYAGDCSNVLVNAFGNLRGTNLKFPQSILPVDVKGYRDHLTTHVGKYTLSENDKRITASTMGRCAFTYYGAMTWSGFDVGMKTHDIPVIFDNLGNFTIFTSFNRTKPLISITKNSYYTFRTNMESRIQWWTWICMQILVQSYSML